MKKVLAMTLAVALCAMTAQGGMELYEDFESYTVDTTIHNQGTDTADAFGRTFRWQAQQNSSALADSDASRVQAYGGNQVLRMSSDYGPDATRTGRATLATTMDMEEVRIDGQGTVYLRYTAEVPSNSHIMTNGLERGWDYEGNATTMTINTRTYTAQTVSAYGWQQGLSGAGYRHMGAVVRGFANDPSQGPGDAEFRPFSAYSGVGGGTAGYYQDPDIVVPAAVWVEMWIQIDHANDRSKYFVCLQGDTPIAAMNPGADGLPNTADDTDWWAMRNEYDIDNNAVRNLKFLVSAWGLDAEDASPVLYIDTIAVDSAAMTTDHYDGWEMLPAIPIGAPPCSPGDADGDGDVDLDDFVILKTNFGATTGMTCADGDFDGDGDVDLDDFVLLKNNFGT